MENRLYVAKNNGSIKETVYRALNAILVNQSFSNVSNIAIKPNLCYYWHSSTGETTDPAVISAIVDYFREKIDDDLNIAIVEADATAMRTKYAFRILGYTKLAKEKRVDLVNLSEVQYSTREINGLFLKEVRVPKTIEEADLLLSVPKLKTHALTTITCVLKNQYGCNPIKRKVKYHPHISEVIADLNLTMKPDLCLIDGIVARGKHPYKLDVIIAGNNSVATDSFAAEIMGHNPKKIRHLFLSKKLGIGDYESIVFGDEIASIKERFPRFSLSEKIKLWLRGLAIKAYSRWSS